MQLTNLQTTLHEKLQKTQLAVTPQQTEKLTNFLLLLQKWNKTYNLTSIDEPMEMIDKHIIDSLLVTPYLKGKKILDVGTGAGLPGIPLAITQPELQFYLLDSNGKKTRFITHAVATLEIKNVFVIQNRVEDYKSEFCFDSIISRAFSSLQKFISTSQHLLCPKGSWLAMKGEVPKDEIAELGTNFSIKIFDLGVAFLHAQRHLVVIERT